MATPMLDATRRCGSRVEFSATTANTTSPGFRYFNPSLRVTNFACGGKIDETRTRFCAATPASRSANSKEVRRSLCFPTPFVKNSRFGTMLFPNFYFLQFASEQKPRVKSGDRKKSRRKYVRSRNHKATQPPAKPLARKFFAGIRLVHRILISRSEKLVTTAEFRSQDCSDRFCRSPHAR